MAVHIVIVEDDPMVAEMNRQYVERFENMHVDAVIGDGAEALDYLRSHKADLLILDVYMPGMSGRELLRELRAEKIDCSVIMVTAAAEMDEVRDAMRLGITDYLIKPFTFERFRDAVCRYLNREELYGQSQTADQQLVDQLVLGNIRSSSSLPKGLHHKTLDLIRSCMREGREEEAVVRQTCESISAAAKLSKVTVRRYLNYMIDNGEAESEIDYETGGRPRVLYYLKK